MPFRMGRGRTVKAEAGTGKPLQRRAEEFRCAGAVFSLCKTKRCVAIPLGGAVILSEAKDLLFLEVSNALWESRFFGPTKGRSSE